LVLLLLQESKRVLLAVKLPFEVPGAKDNKDSRRQEKCEAPNDDVYEEFLKEARGSIW
jgi:hypothetical protein